MYKNVLVLGQNCFFMQLEGRGIIFNIYLHYLSFLGKCTNLTEEITTIIKEEIRQYKVKSYLAAIVPKHAGGVILNYKVCYGNETKKYYQEEIVQLDNGCLLGNMSLFGSTSDVNITSLPIDSEHFKV